MELETTTTTTTHYPLFYSVVANNLIHMNGWRDRNVSQEGFRKISQGRSSRAGRGLAAARSQAWGGPTVGVDARSLQGPAAAPHRDTEAVGEEVLRDEPGEAVKGGL